MKPKKRITALLLCIALCALLGACQSAPVAPAIDTDRAGNPIALPKKVETIVSMAPAYTEVLLDLGLSEKIIAVDSYSIDYYADRLGDVPAFDMMTPDNERITALNPDIVFTSGMSLVGGSDPFSGARNAGICVVNIPSSSSIADVQLDVQFIAECVDAAEKGKALVDSMQKDLDTAAQIGKTIANRKSVLFEVQAAPDIITLGQGTFIHELIELCGATNIFGDQDGWISVSQESVLSLNPDVILTSVDYIDDPTGEIMGRAGWENVSALQSGAVYSVNNRASMLPNHNVVRALKEIALAVYPDEYAGAF